MSCFYRQRPSKLFRDHRLVDLEPKSIGNHKSWFEKIHCICVSKVSQKFLFISLILLILLNQNLLCDMDTRLAIPAERVMFFQQIFNHSVVRENSAWDFSQQLVLHGPSGVHYHFMHIVAIMFMQPLHVVTLLCVSRVISILGAN